MAESLTESISVFVHAQYLPCGDTRTPVCSGGRRILCEMVHMRLILAILPNVGQHT